MAISLKLFEKVAEIMRGERSDVPNQNVNKIDGQLEKFELSRLLSRTKSREEREVLKGLIVEVSNLSPDQKMEILDDEAGGHVERIYTTMYDNMTHVQETKVSADANTIEVTKDILEDDLPPYKERYDFHDNEPISSSKYLERTE